MSDALLIAATGMRAEQTQIDTISNNIANLNTVGFRAATVSFEAVSAALKSSTGSADSNGGVRGAGVVASTQLTDRSGEARSTGRALDIAIDGNGFLEGVRQDGEPVYSRAGSLRVSTDGLLTLADGTPLSAGIQVPSGAVRLSIATDGTVSIARSDTGAAEKIGQIDLAVFANPEGLQSIGGGLFVPTDASGEPAIGSPGDDGMGTVRQGFLEGSNVQLTDQMVSLMVAQRGFELNSRVAQAADQMMSIVNGMFRT